MKYPTSTLMCQLDISFALKIIHINTYIILAKYFIFKSYE